MASMEAVFKQFLKKVNGLQQEDGAGQSGFAREFQMLRHTSSSYKGTKAYSTESGEYPVNRVKNRFKDILPFDYTRVKLPSTGADGSDYINANMIKGVNNNAVYVASQGPLPNTVNDFWRMLWSLKVKVVVMLCRVAENGKKKCHRYWCENEEEKLNFGGIQVKVKKCVANGDDFTIRTMVAEKNGEERILTQFHYTAWPDHGVPPTATSLIELVKLVREYQHEDSPPIILHCSAGCGRTGTICALDYAQTLLKQGRAKEVDPYQIVETLRKQRAAMVQTKGQYEFLCRAMCALFRMQLNLPMEEKMETHFYENVTVDTLEDSSSDRSSSPFHVTKLKGDFVFTPAEQLGSRKNPTEPGPTTLSDKKRITQIERQSSRDSYVNVSFDLIDLSDDGNSQKPQPNVTRTSKGQVTAAMLPKRLSQRGLSKDPFSFDKMDTGDGGNDVKPKLFIGAAAVKQSSSEEYVVPLVRSRSPAETSETSDYVIAHRGKQPTAPTSHSTDKTKAPLGYKGGQIYQYENVLVNPPFREPSQSLPTKKDARSLVGNTQQYENIEVKHSNPGRRSPDPVTTRSQPQHEKATKKGSQTLSPKPSLKPSREFFRSSSSQADITVKSTKPELPFSSCGARAGARCVEQLKAMNGLQRAKVLPNEDTRKEDQQVDADLEQFVKNNDVADGLYASVGSRRKPSVRNQITSSTISSGDSVDGAPKVMKKPPDTHFIPKENPTQHDSSKSDSKNFAKKIPFLAKKSEAKGLPLENIGFGIRLPKPKGPRSPPRSWAVKN